MRQLDSLWRRKRVGRGAGFLIEALETREMLAATYAFTSVASFLGQRTATGIGSRPQGLVMAPNGDMYGLSAIGGPKGYGTIFKVVAGTNVITTVAVFNSTNGASPRGNMVFDASGNLYGTTSAGGTKGKGTVFELPAGSTTITTLVSFTGKDGSFPFAGLVIDGSGNLFGTTGGQLNSSTNKATVFEVQAGTHTLVTIATLGESARPTGTLVVDSGGNIFGTTSKGGKDSRGTVFEIAAGSSKVTTLASFNGTNGGAPDGSLLMDSQGNLIGLTGNGGGITNAAGTLFKLTPNGTASTITTLAVFTGGNGNRPLGTLIMDGGGNIFGVTSQGGGNAEGAAFELEAGASTITKLFGFKGQKTGVNPTGTLVMDGSGNLFGGTFGGGKEEVGTLFELSPV